MNAQRIIDARAAFDGTDAEFIVAANTRGPDSYREYWVNYNTVSENVSPALAEAIYSGLVAAGRPGAAAKFGSNGFDAASETFRAQLDQLIGLLPGFTQDMADAIVAPAVVPGLSQAQADFGCDVLDAAGLAWAQRIVPINALRAALVEKYNADVAKLDELAGNTEPIPATIAEL